MSEIKGCVSIGSGPSLRKLDVGRLRDYTTMAFNRSFVAWPEWGFDPDYYACFDPVAIEDNHERISDLVRSSRVDLFFLNAAAGEFGLRPSERVKFVEVSESGPFSTDGLKVRDFGNVGASSLQILAWLRCRKVVLVGMDARYDRGATGRREGDFIRVDEDKDHFHPDYLHGMRRIGKPDLQKILGQWPLAAEGAREAGLDIVNASPGSRLDCFEKMDFEKALRWLGS